MRKYLRSMMRADAVRLGVKPSRYVSQAWEKHMIDKVGMHTRMVNKAKGTAPKKLWKNRIAAMFG